MTDQQNTPTWAVAMVHGVGESKPIEMLTLVTRALEAQRPELNFEPHINVHLHRDELRRATAAAATPGSVSPKQRATAEAEKKQAQAAFEVLRQHDRCGAIGNSNVQLRFATAHWSDISMFGEGIIRLIGNLALGGMGVRYFADVGTSGTSLLAKTLHGLLALKIWLLALGFLPIVLCTLVFSLFTFIGYYLFRNETFYLQAWIIPIASMVTVWGMARLARNMLGHMREERTLALPIFNMLQFYGYVMGAIILIDHRRAIGNIVGTSATGEYIAAWMRKTMEMYGTVSGNVNWQDRVALLDETGVYVGFLQLLQYFCGYGVICLTAAVLVVLAVSCIPGLATRKQRRGMLLSAVGVTTIWLLMLLVLWPENLITATVLNLYLRNVPDPTIHAIWTFDLQPAWPPVTIESTLVKSVDKLREFMPLIWFDVFFLVFLICVSIVACVIVRKRGIWSRSHNGAGSEDLDAFRPPHHETSLWAPRLILAGSYQFAVIIFMIVISTTALAHTFKVDRWIGANVSGMEWVGRIPHELFMGLANVTLIVILCMALFLLAAHKIQKAIKLTLDVVNHFANPAKAFPIRRKIQQRLLDTVDFLLKPHDRPHFAVVCHSQGTVITLDTLLGHNKFIYKGWGPFKRRKLEWVPGLWETRLKNEVASLTILTFGSPIGHLYQHYFAILYPGLSELEAIRGLYEDRKAGRVRWFNCYRIDDYIGTHVDPLKDDLGEFPVNLPMGIGGHTDYWKQDVFLRLFAEPGMEKILAAGR